MEKDKRMVRGSVEWVRFSSCDIIIVNMGFEVEYFFV